MVKRPVPFLHAAARGCRRSWEPCCFAWVPAGTGGRLRDCEKAHVGLKVEVGLGPCRPGHGLVPRGANEAGTAFLGRGLAIGLWLWSYHWAEDAFAGPCSDGPQ